MPMINGSEVIQTLQLNIIYITAINYPTFLLNQARAGHRPVCPRSVSVRMCLYVCACVCVPTPRLLITSDVIWILYDWLNKFYSCYMATVVGIVNECGLGIDMCCGK